MNFIIWLHKTISVLLEFYLAHRFYLDHSMHRISWKLYSTVHDALNPVLSQPLIHIY